MEKTAFGGKQSQGEFLVIEMSGNTDSESIEPEEKPQDNNDSQGEAQEPLRTEPESEMAYQTPGAASETVFAPGSAPPNKQRKIPRIPVVVILAVIVIIILAAIGAGLFSGQSSISNGKNKDIEIWEPTTWEETETIEGDISGGGPMTFIPDVVVPFEVENTVYQMDILLSWDPQSMDLDLAVRDPSGDERGTSGNSPGTPESVQIKKNIDPGTWSAEIDPFLAANVHYFLEITYYHESYNDTAGEGDLLYQKVKSLAGESGEETDSFMVEDDFKGLVIQVQISSGDGRMGLEIVDTEGTMVYSVEVSGSDQESYQETVDSKKGEWYVNYTFEGFTGTLVVQVIGV